MRNGSVYARPTWVPRTSGSGGSALRAEDWNTPVANDDNKSVAAHLVMKGRMGGNRTAITSLQVQTQAWTTPQAHDATGGAPNRIRRYGTKHGAANLADDVTLWPTPDALSAGGPRSRSAAELTAIQNGEQAGKWHRQLNISDAAMLWQTPSVADTTGGHLSRGGSRSDELLLRGQAKALASSLPDPQSANVGPPSSPPALTSRPRLNPRFVEWLMGLPPNYTIPSSTAPIDCEALETAWCRFRPPSQSANCGNGCMEDSDA
jgi:hypothetical protein